MKFAQAAMLLFIFAAFDVRCPAQGAITQDWQTLTFHFARPEATPSEYTIQLHPDGSGVYWEGQPAYNSEEAAALEKISVSTSLLAKLTASFDAVVAGKCETKQKKIAQTGQKTIVIAADGKNSSCEFNYSDDEHVNAAGSLFLAIASTMQIGEQLARLHRYDRLGLDAEMQTLADEVKAGRAVEVQNIAPVLQSIATDDRVMERVRRAAARLLQDAGVAVDAVTASR